MEVIPVINCSDKACMEKKLGIAPSLGTEWLHIDVTDGKFAPTRTWATPQEISKLIAKGGTEFALEVHLMVERPEDIVGEWLKTGAKRIIVHIESFPSPENPRVQMVIEKCAEYGAEIMFAIQSSTDIAELIPYLDYTTEVQCLAVPIGPAGGMMDVGTVERVEFLRERSPDLTIEIDGGITLETARAMKTAGADIIASGTYIFENQDPRQAYENLVSLQ